MPDRSAFEPHRAARDQAACPWAGHQGCRLDRPSRSGRKRNDRFRDRECGKLPFARHGFSGYFSVPSRSFRSGRNVPILLKNSGWRPLGPSARKLRICRAPTLNHSCALGLDPESIFHRFLRQRVFQQYRPCVDGYQLASGVLVFCLLLVGAAMCSAFGAAFTCAAGHDAFRAGQVPTISSHSKCNGQNGFS
jgi:hypothetical protein